ncbi:MAG TPA: family 78 glycoside hydrolase catalytic domain [Verrucomicrobiae bacterium]|jgi:alpha-L-rhamnosidase
MKLRHVFTILAALFLIVSARAENLSPVKLYALTCEHLTNPVGIGSRSPRLSWKLDSGRAGEVQTAWEVRAASSMTGLASSPDIWDSGKVVSDQSVLVPWGGKVLGSRSQVFWQVRIWDKDGVPTAWSDTASFELGLLDPTNEWHGQWITADLPRYDVEGSVLENANWISGGSIAGQAAAIRLDVQLPPHAAIRAAWIDAQADGRVAIYVNGHVTQHGFTSQTAPLHAEIADELTTGTNIIAIGSAAVRNGIRRDRGQAGRNAIVASGVIELRDGQRIGFNTDSSWRAAADPGDNWFAPDFVDSNWAAATVLAPYSDQPSKYANTTIGPGRYLRTHFTVSKPIVRARLYATALGVYEASINGRRVNDDLLTPGWTDYRKRVMVQTYDVTALIHPGANAVGAMLADGWYAGRLGWMGAAQYGPTPAFDAQLEITYADGTRDVLATDDSWKAGSGGILGSDEQWGEIQDARKAVVDWDQSGFDDSSWTNATLEQHSVELDPQLGPPVRELMELAPQKITRRGETWIVDFGQNLVGHVRLTASGPSGDTITVRHGEAINPDGSLYTENLRTALATDKYTLDGAGRETLEPHFTFHGFRYVEITGYPGTLRAKDLRAVVVGSATPQTGTFESSDPELNRLYQNIVWSQRGNFLSVPTDCPQRDERQGWMGDAQVFSPTAVRNADVSAFFTKWMVDVDDGQGTNGDFSDISPRVARPQPAMAVWGDAGVIIPWMGYTAYGDISFLSNNYPYMARWIDFNVRRSHDLILSGGVADEQAPAPTPTPVVDTAFFANSAQIVSKTAALLGYTNDAAKYDKLYHDIADAFDQSFVSTNGVIQGDTQTGYILALQFGLLPPNLRAVAAQRLAANVEQRGHLSTGFVGNGRLCPELEEIGRSDLAWDLLLTNTYPSWLFAVKNGATTIWERWDGWTPDKGFENSSMNSFNHYSLGSVGRWLYTGAAGIRPNDSAPGYKHFLLDPQFTTRLDYVKATLDTPYGMISSGWRNKGGQVLYDVTIPPNSSATLRLPALSQNFPMTNGVVTLAAGTYHFSLPLQIVSP